MNMEAFKKEVEEMPLEDIMLILEDQVNLYSDKEIAVLKAELELRSSDTFELNGVERNRVEQLCLKAEKENNEKDRQMKIKQQYQNKIDNLNRMGFDGYFEYKVISLNDNDTGAIYSSSIENTLNELGLDGWHLKCAYTNEICQNYDSDGYVGFSAGKNSTMDQNILIFERFVRIRK